MQGLNSACKASTEHARPEQCMQGLDSASKAPKVHARLQQCMQGLNSACLLSVFVYCALYGMPKGKILSSYHLPKCLFFKAIFQLLAALGCKGFFYNDKLNGPL
jgi:hypothetical protein